MNIEIKYFGMLAELTGCNSGVLEPHAEPVSALKNVLFEKYPALKTKDFRIAQNQELVAEDTILTGQEIAVLPPFAGG